MDIFVKYNQASYITFTIPQGSMEHPQWDSFFKWDYLLNSENQYYNDILTAPHLNLDFTGARMYRNIYIVSSHNGCGNDKIWFTILNKGVCMWDKIYNKPSFSTETTIVYSPFRTTGHTLKLASKIELRLAGDFTRNDAQNGYRKVLRYPNAAGVDFLDFYESGITNSSQDR